MDGELAHRTVSRYFPGADKARSDSVRHSPECEAFGTWVLNSCFMEVNMNFRSTKAKRIAACIIAGILVLAMIAPLLAAMS